MIQENYRLVWRLLRRLRVPAEAADDATQQVFLISAERLADIKVDSERAFLFGTALRVASSIRRRRDREPATDKGDCAPSQWPGPEELSDQKRARDLLDAILDDMPLELRTVFILFEIEGLTSPEIVELSGLALGTVASRLRRAREVFRCLVEERKLKVPKGGPT